MSNYQINHLLIRCGLFSRSCFTESTAPSIRKYTNDNSTVDSKEIKHHGKFSNEWWDKQGTFRPLHAFNALRIQFIRDGLCNVGWKEKSLSQPLQNLKILDVGCGGGILSESLARVGANVTGIDASEDLIDIAKEHATHDPRILERIQYNCIAIENHVCDHLDHYDAVVASEVLEHVSNKDLFITCCMNVLKPNGSIFITTLNKSFVSWAAGILLAENMLRIVPPGTHEWDKFISPLDTERLLTKYGGHVKLTHGIFYNPLLNQWSWTSSTLINYAIHAVKVLK